MMMQAKWGNLENIMHESLVDTKVSAKIPMHGSLVDTKVSAKIPIRLMY